MSGEGKRSDGLLGEGDHERHRLLQAPPALYVTALLLDSQTVFLLDKCKMPRADSAHTSQEHAYQVVHASPNEARPFLWSVPPERFEVFDMFQSCRLHKAMLIGFATLMLAGAPPLLAATLTVTNTDDSGPGSLRQTIANASSGDTIVFGVTGMIILLRGELVINKNLTINGPGAGSLEISGNSASRVFNISGPFTVAISGVTIKNAHSASDGGGINNSGTLTVTDSTFSGNSAADGGGITNFGTLTVTNSTFSDNSATTFSGGGIVHSGSGTVTVTNSTFSRNSAANGGGITNFGTLTVTNSTFSDNSATTFSGGGIATAGSGTVTVTNSTFSRNSAANGGGGIVNGGTLMTVTNSTFSGNSAIGGGGIANAGTLTVKNTLLANSRAGGNCSGSIISLGHNLSDDDKCAFIQTGDMNNTPAGLDPGGLKNNGGPTQTMRC